MRLAGSGIAVLALIALTGASGARKNQPPPAAPPPPVVVSGENSWTVGFDHLELRIPLGTTYAKIRCEKGNILTHRDVTVRSGARVNSSDFEPAFTRTLETAGYRTTQASSLFRSTDRGSDAQLLVAGAITELMINACDPPPTQYLITPNAKASITVDWEVYDPVERRVVLKTSTHGEGNVERPDGNPALVAWVAAFASASDALVRQPEFHRLATLPQASPQAPQEPAVVPEAPVATAIARVPLSAVAFQQQTDKILGQVATVLVGRAFGSGFYISDALLLTNQHVVGLSQYVKVRLHSGKEMVGEVISRDAGRDVALIKTESIGSPGLPLRTEEPGIGSQVFVVGTPLEQGLAQSVSAGIISGVREIDHHQFLQSETNTQRGNSGGPMIDDKGNVVAMTDLGLEKNGVARGINFFIPIGDALKSLNVTFAGG